MKKFILVFFFLVGTFATIAQETAKMQEVTELHDKVMAKMPELIKLINKLQTAAQNSEDKAGYELAIEDLKAANMSMQTWMIGFGKRFDADEMMKGKKLTEQKQLWLNEEAKKVEVVDKEVEASFKKAKILLNKE